MALKIDQYEVAAWVSELVGTFFLVLTVGLNVLQNQPLAPLSIGATLMCMIFATGHVSGAHFNPAVTLGVLLCGRDQIAPAKVGFYVLFQLLGGFLAGLTYWALLGSTFALAPGVGYSVLDAAGVEVLFSFALVFVVLNVATTEQDHSNNYFGLAIGFTVISAAFACGPISGCSLNPAVTVGVMLSNAFHTGSLDWLLFLLYICCPVVGGLLAAVVFKYVVRRHEYGQAVAEARQQREAKMKQELGEMMHNRRHALARGTP